MSKFTVNGHSVEFDPFDLDNMELYLNSVDRLDEARRVKMEGETSIENLRRVCEMILDFFDDLLGPGKAQEIFGEKINAKVIIGSYLTFCRQVNDQMEECIRELSTLSVPKPVNREQRRAMNRTMALNKP